MVKNRKPSSIHNVEIRYPNYQKHHELWYCTLSLEGKPNIMAKVVVAFAIREMNSLRLATVVIKLPKYLKLLITYSRSSQKDECRQRLLSVLKYLAHRRRKAHTASKLWILEIHVGRTVRMVKTADNEKFIKRRVPSKHHAVYCHRQLLRVSRLPRNQVCLRQRNGWLENRKNIDQAIHSIRDHCKIPKTASTGTWIRLAVKKRKREKDFCGTPASNRQRHWVSLNKGEIIKCCLQDSKPMAVYKHAAMSTRWSTHRQVVRLPYSFSMNLPNQRR